MKILILGGGGFIGINLTKALLKDGFDVRVFEHPNNNSRKLFNDSKNLEWITGDFTNPQHVSNAVRGCKTVFHLISTTLPANSNRDPVYDTQSNVVSSVYMINAAKEAGVKKIIFASSGGTVYGIPQELPITESHPTNPICSYGISKLAIEKHLSLSFRNGGPNYVALRLSNPYGPMQPSCGKQGIIGAIIEKIMKKEPLKIWGDGSIVRDFVYIEDVVSAFIRAMLVEGHSGVYNVGCGEGCSINNLVDLLDTVFKCGVEKSYTEKRNVDVSTNILNCDLFTNNFMWRPKFSLQDGLLMLSKHLKKISSANSGVGLK